MKKLSIICILVLSSCVKPEHVNENSRLIHNLAEIVNKHHPDAETESNLKDAYEQKLKDAAIVNKEAVAKAFKLGAQSAGSMLGVPAGVTDAILVAIALLFGSKKVVDKRNSKKKAGQNDS